LADIVITVPNEHVDRVKAAFIGQYRLDPAITNADLLAFVKSHFASQVRDTVRSWEHQEAVRIAAETAPPTDGIAT
jgi:hypothetical protein